MTYRHRFIAAFVAFMTFTAFPASVRADAFAAEFESSPLFSETNFAPGKTVTKWVKVTNNYGNERAAVTNAQNASDPGNLSEHMRISISDGSTIMYEGSLASFLAAKSIPLSAIPAKQAKTYSYSVTLLSGAVNGIQGESLGFDLCVGFEYMSGGSACSGDSSGERGRGRFRGSTKSAGQQSPIRFMIYGEQASSLETAAGSVRIEWDTTKPATSKVVYGKGTGFPFDASKPPLYGYPLVSANETSGSHHHSVTLTGLEPGATYEYRAVSESDSLAISYSHTFVVPGSSGANVSRMPSRPMSRPSEITGQEPEKPLKLGAELASNQGETRKDKSNAAAVVLGLTESQQEKVGYITILIFVIILAYLLGQRIRKRGTRKL